MLYHIAVGMYEEIGNHWVFLTPHYRTCFYVNAGYNFYVEMQVKDDDIVYYDSLIDMNLLLS